MTSTAGTPAPSARSTSSSALGSAWRRWRELVTTTGPTVWVVGALLLAVAVADVVRGDPSSALAPTGMLGVVVARSRLAVVRERRTTAVVVAQARALAEAEVRARVREELARAEGRREAPAAEHHPSLALHYRGWDEGRGAPRGEEVGATAARALFEAGEPVTALVGAPDAPTSVLEVRDRGRQVVVTHLDRLQRPSVRYLWAVPGAEEGWPDHRLLLHTVVVTEHDHDHRPPEDHPTTTETYRFTTVGAVRGERLHLPTGDVQVLQHHDPAALQVEDVPAFGEWAALVDRERSTSS